MDLNSGHLTSREEHVYSLLNLDVHQNVFYHSQDTGTSMKIGILGCGIAGSFLAYFLKKRGVDVVCVSERREYPSVGLIQSLMQKFDEDMEMARRTRQIYSQVAHELEIGDWARQVRSYTVVHHDRESILRELVSKWTTVGADVKYADQDEALPFRTYDDEIVLVCKNDLLVRVDKIVSKLWEVLKVKKGRGRIETSGGKPRIVVGNESYEVDIVVIACGAWTRKILQELGVEKPPFVPYKCQAGVFALSTTDDMYILYDYVNRIYVRPAPHLVTGLISRITGTKIMIAGNGNTPPMDPDNNEENVEPWFRDEIEPKLRRRYDKVHYLMGHAGFCDVTPDSKPAIGKVKDWLYVISGFNGYGAEVGPAVAEILSKLVLSERLTELEKRYLIDRFKSVSMRYEIPQVEAHEL